MKHIKTFEGFLNEDSSILNNLKSACKGATFSPGSVGEVPEGYTNATAYDVEHPDADEGFSVLIYDDSDFCFFYDATPVVTSLNTPKEKMDSYDNLNPYPKPLSKLTPAIWKEILREIGE